MISLSLKNRADAEKVLNLNENLAVRKSFLEKAFPESKIGGTRVYFRWKSTTGDSLMKNFKCVSLKSKDNSHVLKCREQ